MSAQPLAWRLKGSCLDLIPGATSGYQCPLPHRRSQSQPVCWREASPEPARALHPTYLSGGDSCASIFIRNSQETWMKGNYLSSINPD